MQFLFPGCGGRASRAHWALLGPGWGAPPSRDGTGVPGGSLERLWGEGQEVQIFEEEVRPGRGRRGWGGASRWGAEGPQAGVTCRAVTRRAPRARCGGPEGLAAGGPWAAARRAEGCAFSVTASEKGRRAGDARQSAPLVASSRDKASGVRAEGSRREAA